MADRRTRAAKRPLTLRRSPGYSTDEETEVRLEPGWAEGLYVVRYKGSTIAYTTDKWMADMILKEACRGRKK